MGRLWDKELRVGGEQGSRRMTGKTGWRRNLCPGLGSKKESAPQLINDPTHGISAPLQVIPAPRWGLGFLKKEDRKKEKKWKAGR